MKKACSRVIIIGIVLVGFAQLIQPTKTSGSLVEADDFLVSTQAPPTISEIVKRTCYDCHSNRSENSWISRFSPISWWIGLHVEHGRRSLNLSIWNQERNRFGIYWSAMRTAMVVNIQHNKMPPSSYSVLHRGGSLTQDERRILIEWLNELNFDSVPREN